jgi:plasmid stabilization system protein ParE
MEFHRNSRAERLPHTAAWVRATGTQCALGMPVGCLHPSCSNSTEFNGREEIMPRGDKSKYSDKQKRKAEHIEDGYTKRGVPEDEAERRAWATVNKESGGGNKSGSGRGRPDTHVSSNKGGKLGGAAAAARPAKERAASAKKAAATRKRNAARAGR